ncbi:FAD-binding oxidoreductase [Vibrio sp. D404a]|uniref:NAD(P)/FAD-dependent oxidoreductase n=1 Tax=unclassified Vibrio TaxID=2614977 RepID=UPI0025558072|nr:MULTISPECIES: FAD-binding oxidoreductase [unclassified Vibrio]MDK9736020.1 FAD-binding oxidoreductase [Vibrio sp. D404a]MDK9797814.1 FAD-binding oxidoreductase [Vibrio sp. D449a]
MNLPFVFKRVSALFIGTLLLITCGIALGKPTTSDFEPNTSYWFQEKPNRDAPPLRENTEFDIAIIGGGYTGLSSAWHLAKTNPQLKIAIFEAKQVGSGASGRNGGMVLPGSEVMDIYDAGEASKRHYDITVKSMRKLQALIESTGVNTDLMLNGYVEAILDKDAISDYRDYVRTGNRLGIPFEYWDADTTKKNLGTERYVGAVYDPNGGQVHAMKLVNALRKAAEQVGVIIYEHSPILGIKEGKQIELNVADKYTVVAGNIVLATNGYTSKLGYFSDRLFPVHAQSAVTEQLTKAQLNSIQWQKGLPFYDTRKLLYHLVMTPDNRIVIGGGNAEYFLNDGLKYKGNLDKVKDLMMAELISIYPELNGIKFESVWNGVLGMTSNSNEIVGVTGSHENVYYALGYNGHGINLSFLFGEIIASLYNGQTHPWFNHVEESLPMRLPPEPLKATGIKGTLIYYKKQDETYINR